jgi:hypothetical protein
VVAQHETADIHVLTTVTAPGPRRLVMPPEDDEFDGDFLPALAVEKLADELRMRHNMPTEISIAYLWKRKGGKTKGKTVLGRCNMVSGLTKYYGSVDFVIWLAADNCREAALTQHQFEALIHHELQHAGVDDESLEPKLIGHDIEEFRATIEHYGLWDADLIAAAHSFEQARMFA